MLIETIVNPFIYFISCFLIIGLNMAELAEELVFCKLEACEVPYLKLRLQSILGGI